MPGMKIVDRAKLEAAYQGFNTVFQGALQNAPSFYRTLAMIVQSNAPLENYNWLGELPQMRKWVSDRALAQLRAFVWQIRNEWWANGIEVSLDDIRDDRLGLVTPRIQALAAMAELHKDQLVFDLLKLGATSLCYDGQFFFDTDHQDGSEAAQSNKSTTALSSAEYNSAWQAMISFTDPNGEPLNVTPTHLVVGPKLRSTARTILLAERGASGATNLDFGTANLIVSPRLVGTYDDYWFLLDLSKPVKPIVFQERTPVSFKAQDDPTDEHMFMRRVARYGADGEYNAGYGLWQLAWGGIVP
jgi:phage major head subunit gpT-like protein